MAVRERFAQGVREHLQSVNATHLLILCPRGFANERPVYGIPADCVEDARQIARRENPQDDVRLTRLVPIEEDMSDSRWHDAGKAAARISGFASPGEYREYLYCIDGPLLTALDI